ncbi:MAG TPA: glycoside hydrolase family 127 protein [Sedimentisphaerales bacterium]|nr:glycoside hydrolase family 127 protein [Sedimentisphaerales bacterium]
MYRFALTMLVSVFMGTAMTQDYPVTPVPFTDVSVSDNFWSPRLKTSREITLPSCFKRCEEIGLIDNFAVAGGLIEGIHRGARYGDSDLYKVMQGAAYQLSLKPNLELDRYVDGVIFKIAAAQMDDGYLSTPRIITPELDITKTDKKSPNAYDMYGKQRWSRMDHGHELYCMGHMIEAAVAHYQATGRRNFLDVAIKSAGLICRTFGPNEDQLHNVPGHQEIELALVKLYRATGEKKYLDMAKYFLDERGHYNGRTVHMHKESKTYAQDDIPVIEQRTPHGHVVRAAYLYCGMADIAALTGDKAYLKAIDAIWGNIVSKRLYLIGSMGVQGYAEGFGPDYKLPNQEAYNETCATIGTSFLNHRLFLLHKDAKYFDLFERSLYNGVLAAVSLKGDEFFYPNPLASDGVNNRHERKPWYSTACCPSNIARFMPSVPGYIYAHDKDGLYINLFIGGKAKIEMTDQTVNITQATGYPWDGKVSIGVDPDKSGAFDILIRIPGWAQNKPVPSDLYHYMNSSDEQVTVKVNGEPIPIRTDKGYLRIGRTWQKGDQITLDMPMPIRRVLSHEKVEDNAGRVAIERGPIVYCAEWVDNMGEALDLILPDDVALRAERRDDMFDGITLVRGELPNGSEIKMIPYYAWGHRGRGEMNVWLKRQ